MDIVSCILIILFFALLIAEIVEFFVESDEFDGLMLFARPVIVLVLVLLDGQSFWAGILYGLLWGFLGFVIHALVDEHFSHKKEEIRSLEQMLKDLQKATDEERPQERAQKLESTEHVEGTKETQTKQPFDDIPSVPITKIATTTISKPNRVVPNDLPPSKNTSATPLDVPPPDVETYNF